MAKKRIIGRQLRHGSPEDILEGLDHLLAEMTFTEPAGPVDLAKIIIEDRG